MSTESFEYCHYVTYMVYHGPGCYGYYGHQSFSHQKDLSLDDLDKLTKLAQENDPGYCLIHHSVLLNDENTDDDNELQYFSEIRPKPQKVFSYIRTVTFQCELGPNNPILISKRFYSNNPMFTTSEFRKVVADIEEKIHAINRVNNVLVFEESHDV